MDIETRLMLVREARRAIGIRARVVRNVIQRCGHHVRFANTITRDVIQGQLYKDSVRTGISLHDYRIYPRR